MTQESRERPNPKEVVKDVEEFVENTPPDVVRRMRQMQDERREVHSPANLGDLMTKRLG